MNKYLAGAVAGIVATIPMSMLMLHLHRRIPRTERRELPPEQITGKIADGAGAKGLVSKKTEKETLTVFSHFGYGAACGALYAALVPKINLPAAVGGMVFGVAVWTGSYLGWLPLFAVRRSAIERPASENAMMIAAHVVFGSILGLMMKSLAGGRNPRPMRDAGIGDFAGEPRDVGRHRRLPDRKAKAYFRSKGTQYLQRTSKNCG